MDNMKTFKLFFSILITASCVASAAPPASSKDSSQALELARQLNQAFIEVADKVSPAVVTIEVTQKQSAQRFDESNPLWDMLPPEMRRRFFDENGQPRGNNQPRQRRQVGSGSGIVITEDGYILTNNHVVEDAEKITVRFKDSQSFTAEVKGVDPQSDLAVIKINAKGLIPAKLGDSAATRIGEFVVAVGAPFSLDYSVTVGHVSAKGRAFAEFGGYADQDFIQTDASINPGNSGGPLVNLYGEVIGINSMIRGLNTGIGFAIPSNLAKQVMDHLIREGKFVRARIGVGINDLREYQDYKTKMPNLKDGVVIDGILPDGPAAKSELKAGDVVVAVDGKPVKTSRELKEEIAYKKVGQVVTLDVARLDAANKIKDLKIKVKTDAIPDDKNVAQRSTSSGTERSNFGISVGPLTKEVADEYEIETTSGVVVTAVESESIAEEKRIKVGDVITEVNRTPVSNPRKFREAMNASDPKKGVVINFISDGTSRFTVLKED
jgi:serine protease Do